MRKLPPVPDRVETGVVQFGDDWPGVFIRGDNAAYYSMAAYRVSVGTATPFEQQAVNELHT